MSPLSRFFNVLRSSVAEERVRAKGLVRTDETSFLPAAMEIIERPISPTARATAWVLLIGLAVTVMWLFYGQIDVVASAEGRLIPPDNVKLIQPAEAGIVRAILVHDGQSVRKGQPLIELDPTVSTAEAVQASRALESAELDAARSRAILNALDGRAMTFNPPQGTSKAMAADQAALAWSELEGILAAAATHRADRQAAMSARGEATEQARKLTETLPLLDEQIDANEQLLAKGYVSKLKVVEMRRQRLAALRDRNGALQSTNKATAQMNAAESGMRQSRAEARTRVLTSLTKAETESQVRREELTKANQRSGLQRLRSPVDGTIAQLSVHTVGGVVETAKPLMIIVPSSGTLVAEVKVLNKDVGFVRSGQAVSIKLNAFPFSRYGTIPGRIMSIASDSVSDEKLGLIYVARIGLERSSIVRDGRTVGLPAGLTAIADIRTGRRTIASYLISPIDEARLSAGRER